MVPLRILIANTSLATRTGTELYVRDLAIGLLRRHQVPIVYSPRLGEVAEELRSRTVPVVDDLDAAGAPPDVIHGNHNLETVTALFRFQTAPAVFVCHDNLARSAVPPRFPRILRYVAVDDTCRDRMIFEHGIPEARIAVVLNSVDLERFRPRAALPPRPARALVFSNNAVGNHLDAVRTACGRTGLALDVVGASSGNASPHPEALLGRYDLVFAKGRCALEALAVGTAVVLCDYRGVGPMVTTGELDRLRSLNFGHRALEQALAPDVIEREVGRYDAGDAAEVSRRIRARAGLAEMVDELIQLYHEVRAEHAAAPLRDADGEAHAAAGYLRWLSRELAREREAVRDSVPMRIADRILRIPRLGRWARAVARKVAGRRAG